VSGVDDRAKEESGDWSAGGEENAVVFNSAEYVSFVDRIYGMKVCTWLDLLHPENE
jgi:hypothetical protein